MRHYLAILVFLLGGFLLARPAQAQFDDNQYYFGITFQYVDVYELPTEEPLAGLNYTGLTLGGHYPLRQFNDRASLSINPQATGGFILSNFAGSVFFQLPVMLMGRVGANSTKFNESRVGFGVGVGPSFTYLGLRVRDQFGQSLRVQQSFLAPAVAAELSFGSAFGGSLTIRVQANLSRSEGEFNLTPAEYYNFNWGFVYYIDDLF